MVLEGRAHRGAGLGCQSQNKLRGLRPCHLLEICPASIMVALSLLEKQTHTPLPQPPWVFWGHPVQPPGSWPVLRGWVGWGLPPGCSLSLVGCPSLLPLLLALALLLLLFKLQSMSFKQNKTKGLS